MNTLEQIIAKRMSDTKERLKEASPDCFNEQKHLDAGTPEQTYWNYGYMMALKDVLKLWGSSEVKQ